MNALFTKKEYRAAARKLSNVIHLKLFLSDWQQHERTFYEAYIEYVLNPNICNDLVPVVLGYLCFFRCDFHSYRLGGYYPIPCGLDLPDDCLYCRRTVCRIHAHPLIHGCAPYFHARESTGPYENELD